MNERKPTWNCPVCDSKASYSDLLIDGYFQEVLESKDLPEDENDIILEQDGSWKPVPKEEREKEAEEKRKREEKEGSKEKVVECFDLSDDDEPLAPRPPGDAPPPQPPLPPTITEAPPPPMPPMPPAEIECIDLD